MQINTLTEFKDFSLLLHSLFLPYFYKSTYENLVAETFPTSGLILAFPAGREKNIGLV